MLDVQCSSLNNSFSRSFTVQLSPELDSTIAVRVPVHGTGVHLGYVYIIEATLHTTDGRILRSDPIITGMTLRMYTIYHSSIQCCFTSKNAPLSGNTSLHLCTV